jgi:hypothetical protein
VLVYETAVGPAQEMAQRKHDDEGIIELSGNGNEVRDEIQRAEQIKAGEDKRDFAATRKARIADQSTKQDRTVGYEARGRTGVAAAAGRNQRAHHH